MAGVVNEYRASLKNLYIEDIFDIVLYRPLAFLLVKIIIHFPVSPNQISFLAVISGILSGYFFGKGDRESFIIAALFYGFSNVLDACDGMIARLKNKVSTYGRIIDGISDYIVSLAVYLGFGIGISNDKIDLPINSWILVTFALISYAIHAMIYDYYRSEFLKHSFGKKISAKDDYLKFSKTKKELRKQRYILFKKILIHIYLLYLKLQLPKKQNISKYYDKKRYLQSNKNLIFFWGLIGSSAHSLAMIFAALFYNPMILLFYNIVIGNFLMLILYIIQIRTNKAIAY